MAATGAGAGVQVADNGIDYPVGDAEALGIDEERLADLVARAARDVEEGVLPSCQLAVARHGQLALSVTLGDATPDSRYVAFSCTKALTGSSVWLLMGQGLVGVDQPVAELIDGFTGEGRERVTVSHLLTHTAGFPFAPLGPRDWNDGESRRRRYARWQPRWEPGTRFEYHATAAHWLLADIVESVTGRDHRAFFAEEIATPLGVALTLGAPEGTQDDVERLVAVGEPPSAEELAALGYPDGWDPGEAAIPFLLALNEPASLAVGLPGGGGVGTAADFALFYQGLLANPAGLWDAEVLRLATAEVLCRLPDPMLGIPANRSLGLTIAGDDGHAGLRGFGRTASPATFGHMGAGGQIAWADPVSGVSFSYLTNGLVASVPDEWRRSAALCNRAGALVAD